jgi:uncharacterized membrane protein YdbT with pleckstrin-like domain
MKPEPSPDEPQPVAYDAEGRPLYAHPPKQAKKQEHNVVHMTRMVEPIKQKISPAVQRKHERSMRLYPFLNLSEGEYIIRAVRRHPIGLIIPMAVGVILLALTLSAMFNYEAIAESLNLRGAMADPTTMVLPIALFSVLVVLGMYIAYYVYVNNKFFLTNESVIQEIQVSLFSRHEQTVSLANIEDASFRQENIIQHLFNYGSIRLSTEGDETTYRFSYVANPKRHVAVLNDAVEAFKNGRPVNDD